MPTLSVYNKIDLTGEPPHIGYSEAGKPNRVYISAHTGQGIDELTLAVQQLVVGQLQAFDLTLPPNFGQLQHELHKLDVIKQIAYNEQCHALLQVQMGSQRLQQLLGEFGVVSFEILPRE